MKSIKIFGTAALSLCLLLGTSCGSMTNTGKGALIGGGGGAGAGALIGGLIGGGKGAAIGAAVGAGVGAGAGALIGKRMDKQQKQLQEELKNAQIESVQDQNGLQAIKITFPGGILFPTNGTSLSADAKKELGQFAASLNSNPNTDVQIFGYTDNTGSSQANEKVANGRADAVRNYLIASGVSGSRISAVGRPMTDYVASNDTAEGRALNRRVEIYITADQTMIQQAENGTLQ